MEPITTPHLLARFADHIDHAGIARVPADVLAAFVSAARAIGASEVLIGVLVDPTEPAVARERAFGKLASRLIGDSPRSAATPCSRVMTDSRLARGQTPIVTRPEISAQV